VELLGYHRKGALRALRARPKPPAAPALSLGRPREDPPATLLPMLKPIGFAAFQPCGSGLVARLPEWLPAYEADPRRLAPHVRQREAEGALQNPPELGRLMNINHALLEAIGVGHPALSRLVLASRAAGALGAKITGAGGGGCMIALTPKRARGRVAGAMESCDAQALITTIDTEGARREAHA